LGAGRDDAEVVQQAGVARVELVRLVQPHALCQRHRDERDALGVARLPPFRQVYRLAEGDQHIAYGVTRESAEGTVSLRGLGEGMLPADVAQGNLPDLA